MSLAKYQNKKIALLGLGLENLALLFFLIKKLDKKNLQITICDLRSPQEIIKKNPALKKIKNILKWQSGPDFNYNLEKFNLLLRSPGWPLNCPELKKASQKGVEISSPMNLFFQLSPSKKIIAVSGTKGKGTTASLIYQIIKDSQKSAFLGGNIGIAPFSFLEKIKKNDYLVLELSSFQLEDLNFKPQIAVLTNLFKEHLSPADPYNPNFHLNLKSYLQAKMSLVKQQEKNNFLIVNKNLENKIKNYQQKNKINSQIIFFSKGSWETQLFGDFNQENISAALTVAEVLKIKKTLALKTVKNFSNLEHRLRLVAQKRGVSYFNNSFATTPESTIADLVSFQKNIILLAGGADKGADFYKLAKEIKKRVKFLILFQGPGSQRMKKDLNKVSFNKKQMVEVDSMKKAVWEAQKRAQKEDVVLLSTACASFGLFKNYKERGRLFEEELKKILKNK